MLYIAFVRRYRLTRRELQPIIAEVKASRSDCSDGREGNPSDGRAVHGGTGDGHGGGASGGRGRPRERGVASAGRSAIVPTLSPPPWRPPRQKIEPATTRMATGSRSLSPVRERQMTTPPRRTAERASSSHGHRTVTTRRAISSPIRSKASGIPMAKAKAVPNLFRAKAKAVPARAKAVPAKAAAAPVDQSGSQSEWSEYEYSEESETERVAPATALPPPPLPPGPPPRALLLRERATSSSMALVPNPVAKPQGKAKKRRGRKRCRPGSTERRIARLRAERRRTELQGREMEVNEADL